MTERLAHEANGTRLDEQRFPGRQGRILFAYLAAQEGRPVPRYEMAELLWGEEELSATWEKALRVLMTKLRTLLTECGIDGATALTSAFGCYQLKLPAGAWIDVHAAAVAVERAEAALAAGDLDEARAQASTAAELARRIFLPGEEGPWVEDQRRDLRDILVRALDCLRDVALATGDEPPPRVLPTSLVRLDPKTLEPTQVVKIGPRADLVVVAGDYVWVTHGLLRYTRGGIRDAGDRMLTRVDPSTGDSRPVAGGLAPCGVAADPSGDVWVANCF